MSTQDILNTLKRTPIPRTALTYAEKMGIGEAAEIGYGPSHARSALAMVLPRIRRQLMANMATIGMNRETQFGGANSSVFGEQEGLAVGEAVAGVGSTVAQAEMENESRKWQAGSTMLGVLAGQDAMQAARDLAITEMQLQVDQQPSWVGSVFKGLSTAAMFL